MKISKEDPLLTAYALGEITDAEQLKAIETLVTESPELQKTVDEIRGMGNMLSEELGAEPIPELTEFEKARLEQAPVEAPKKARPLASRLLSWPVLSATTAAAAVLLVITLAPQSKRFALPESEGIVLNESLQSLPEEEAGAVVADVVDWDAGVAQSEKKGDVIPVPQLPDVAVVKRETAKAAPAVGRVVESDEVYELSTFVVAAEPVRSKEMRMPSQPIMPPAENWNTEGYDMIEESDFRSPLVAPLSTFSIDVDTASYANVRRFLNQGQLPPEDAVRIEELINYFPYSDAPPTQSLEEGGDPFSVHMAQTVAPWNTDHRLLRIALKGYEMPWDQRPASNLVFLLDVSGSMSSPNKLPLVKEAMDLLIRRLDDRDRVAIVVYAGASGLVLPSTTANNHETIAHALENLSAGGSTNAGAGIELAYKVARDHFIEDGNNRVILCTDGDFNVGQTNRGSLADVADEQAEKGISLTILGFGMGNYKDGMLEELSNKGKGSYAYVDSSAEARKVFLEDLTRNLFKIAKDVKIQVEFNPGQVNAYRLIGYENRRLKAEDFNNDKKKAGDIGPGHSIVALYEVIPVGAEGELPAVDPLRYQASGDTQSVSEDLATVKLRYKQPEGTISKLITHSVRTSDSTAFDAASDDFRFSAAVAAFGMRLSRSEHVAEFPYREIERIANSSIGSDPGGHRIEFTGLVRKADDLSER
jgi:Ca-activated chloride channel family protein